MNPTAATAADPLAGLRGYHLPAPPSWWPPAPGWWVLAGLVVLLIALLGWWALRRYRRRAAARQARDELVDLQTRLEQQGDRAAFVRGLSKLLRRYAMVVFSRRRVAALAGEQWLAFLDDHGGGERFRNGPGRQLIEAPYRRDSEIDPDTLVQLVGDWVSRNREVVR